VLQEAYERNYIKPDDYVIVATGVNEGVGNHGNLLKVLKFDKSEFVFPN
jgi:hypothetical protein